SRETLRGRRIHRLLIEPHGIPNFKKSAVSRDAWLKVDREHRRLGGERFQHRHDVGIAALLTAGQDPGEPPQVRQLRSDNVRNRHSFPFSCRRAGRANPLHNAQGRTSFHSLALLWAGSAKSDISQLKVMVFFTLPRGGFSYVGDATPAFNRASAYLR